MATHVDCRAYVHPEPHRIGLCLYSDGKIYACSREDSDVHVTVAAHTMREAMEVGSRIARRVEAVMVEQRCNLAVGLKIWHCREERKLSAIPTQEMAR